MLIIYLKIYTHQMNISNLKVDKDIFEYININTKVPIHKLKLMPTSLRIFMA